MVYYGLTLNVGSLGGSIYLNFFLSGAVETLANIVTIWALPRMGRKKFHCISMLVGGVANVSFLIPVLVGGGSKLQQNLSVFIRNRAILESLQKKKNLKSSMLK